MTGMEPIGREVVTTQLLGNRPTIEASAALIDETFHSSSMFLGGESPREFLKVLSGDLPLNPFVVQEEYEFLSESTKSKSSALSLVGIFLKMVLPLASDLYCGT